MFNGIESGETSCNRSTVCTISRISTMDENCLALTCIVGTTIIAISLGCDLFDRFIERYRTSFHDEMSDILPVKLVDTKNRQNSFARNAILSADDNRPVNTDFTDFTFDVDRRLFLLAGELDHLRMPRQTREQSRAIKNIKNNPEKKDHSISDDILTCGHCKQSKPDQNLYKMLLEKFNLIEIKLSKIENLLKNGLSSEYILTDNSYLSVLEAMKQTIVMNNQKYALQEHELTEIRLRLSSFEDEVQERKRTNILIEKMVNSILRLEEKQKKYEDELPKKTENRVSNICEILTLQPPPPPPPPPPTSSSLGASITNEMMAFNRPKISVEDLRSVKLRPVCKTLTT